MLSRNKPLRRTGFLARGGWLRRVPMKPYRPAPRSVSKATVTLVLARACRDGAPCCEVCGGRLYGDRGYDWSLHHRRGRDGRPDSHSAANQLVVHGAGNRDLCHGVIHANTDGQSVANGWLVSRNARPVPDPLTVPVLVDNGQRWVYLTADGGYREAS